jgi:hypothetical protein
MPVDAKKLKVIVIRTHHGHGEQHEIPELVDAYMPHWATCPNAADFKKGEEHGKESTGN